MKERPILFSGPMVRAILAGTKTQTRRACREQPSLIVGDVLGQAKWYADADPDQVIRCPYGVPGDRLWVREKMRVIGVYGPKDHLVRLRYEADGGEATVPYPARLAAPVIGKCIAYGGHREGSRLTLEISAVRVERLQDISDADIAAEGVTVAAASALLKGRHRGISQPLAPWSLRDAWRLGWSAINGPESWEANPWVWALSFAKIGGAP